MVSALVFLVVGAAAGCSEPAVDAADARADLAEDDVGVDVDTTRAEPEVVEEDARPEPDVPADSMTEPGDTLEPDECAGRIDGTGCGEELGVVPSRVVSCQGGRRASAVGCNGVCETPEPGRAECRAWVDTLCAARADGTWCGVEVGYEPDPIGLVTCLNERVAYIRACGGGCRAEAGGSTCFSDDVDVCVDLPDGRYCGDIAGAASTDVILECEAGVIVAGELCALGCVDLADSDVECGSD
jgi:hypothetical protein